MRWALLAGNFTIGCGVMVVAGTLNDMARSLQVGVAAAGQASFVYTMIHELGHGLGFLDSFDAETGQLLNPIPFPYDVFVNRGSARRDVVTDHGADQRLADLTSNDLFFNGPKAVEASARSIRPLPMVKLYAPDPYEQGSSVAHVDQDTYADFKAAHAHFFPPKKAKT